VVNFFHVRYNHSASPSLSQIGSHMKSRRQDGLPLVPLLDAYVAAGLPSRTQLAQVPGWGQRVQAILDAPRQLLLDTFLDRAGSDQWQQTLDTFYRAVVAPPLHAATIRHKAGFLRHTLAYLLRSTDPITIKCHNCIAAEGAYHVAGLGPSFWSALLQALNPSRHPAWTPAVEAGVRRLDQLGWQPHDPPQTIYQTLLDLQGRFQRQVPGLSALHLEHFLSLIAQMDGCDLWSGAHRLTPAAPALDLQGTLRQVREQTPLRERLRERGQNLAAAQAQLEEGLRTENVGLLSRALLEADPHGERGPLSWKNYPSELTRWLGLLWEADNPAELLAEFWSRAELPGAGLWLPTALLHLRDPQRFPLFNDRVRARLALLDDSLAYTASPLELYQLACAASQWLREQFTLHPLETPAFLEGLATTEDAPALTGQFDGFSPDTFRFLQDLARNNSAAWMEHQRARYRFAVHTPLVQLCRALTERYVEPILRRRQGWPLETRARKGQALTSICKNDFGRSDPYQTTLWIVFSQPRKRGRGEVQFVVRLDETGLFYGLRISGRSARERLIDEAERVTQILHGRAAVQECHLQVNGKKVESKQPDDVRTALTRDGEFLVGRLLPRESPLLRDEGLVGDIVLSFDAVAPLYGLILDPPQPAPLAFDAVAFTRATYLDDGWLQRARSLLEMKRQLILQGVPGTGKTHVAQSLARVLTGDNADSIRLVQFHPAYSYEEFIEGIRVQSVETEGRREVVYPVEPGLLCTFADRAAQNPGRPHVLLIDEINRGNLPRIFGEMLYLLEYRDKALTLPCSRREFRLPSNLYLIGTMNVADRSTAPLDQALRRRFAFLDMPPAPELLRAWLSAHPPREPGFADLTVRLLERLNERLREILGAQSLIGHSYFMVEQLDPEKLASVWDHQIAPLLSEWQLRSGGKWVDCDMATFLKPRRRTRAETYQPDA